LSALLDDNEIAARAIIYSLNSTSNRIAIVRAAACALMLEGPERRAFVWMLDKINTLQKRRNELVHGEYWHGDDNSLDLMLIRPMNKETFVVQPVHLDQVKEHVAKCEEWEFRLSLACDPQPRTFGLRGYWLARSRR
jgi:hypothetical protein